MIDERGFERACFKMERDRVGLVSSRPGGICDGGAGHGPSASLRPSLPGGPLVPSDAIGRYDPCPDRILMF